MEKKGRNVGIAGIILIFSMIGLVYGEKCPELSNYVDRTYFVHKDMESNFVEFDIAVNQEYFYLFDWGNITQILKFLKYDLGLEWVEDGKINKSEDGRSITITMENATCPSIEPVPILAEFKIDKEEGKAKLVLSCKKYYERGILKEVVYGKSYEYILKETDNKLKVYAQPLIPIYIYIDKPFVQQMFVINLTQKANDKYFDRVKLNLKDTAVSEIYLDKPGIHTLLITTDAHYYREDISDLCMPKNPYPFTWDDISENNVEFMKFLREKVNLGENVKVIKSDNEINITDGKRSLTLSKKEDEVILKIIGGETYKYMLKEENGERIYPYPCNVLPHPCRKSDRILKHIKVISKERDYGIIYKFVGLININESISYFEKPATIKNIGNAGNHWKLFLLSNSSAINVIKKSMEDDIRNLLINATEIKRTLTSAVVVEGAVYDKDANPVKGAVVRIYLVGIEPRTIRIVTITDEEGKFKIYHEPAGNYTYRLPIIEAFNPDDKIEGIWQGVVYSELADSVNISAPPKKYIKVEEVPFPVLETFIVGLIIGSILVLVGTGYMDKIINAISGKKEEHGH